MKIEYTGDNIPVRSTDGSAGYDIKSTEEASIYPGTSHKFTTGLRIAIPEGYVGIVKARSGLSFNRYIEIGAGVIDSDYRGEIRVHLYNHGDTPVIIYPGDRIAQLLIQKHETPEFVYVNDINDTARGINGFGSTGV
jgi:dUTP pyrophosphatase